MLQFMGNRWETVETVADFIFGASKSLQMVSPVVMYGCESWTIKKAEHRRIDALNCGIGEDS